MEHHISFCTWFYIFLCSAHNFWQQEATSKLLVLRDAADERINGVYLWNHWQCGIKSAFSSLFYVSLRKCSERCSFSLLLQNMKRWGSGRAKQIRKDQSVQQSNQCFLSTSPLKCLSNKCAKCRRATGSDRHRLRFKAMSENLMWQLESVRRCYLVPHAAARPIRCITGAETLLLISHGMNMQT